MKLNLTKAEIDAFFRERDRARLNKDLAVYDYLRKELRRAHLLPEYQKKFNYFYQVRRNAAWRRKFYKLFFAARGRALTFADILEELFHKTKRVEASFASKLAATLNADLPIIDRHVLSYIGRKLPSANKRKKERIVLIIELHKEMEEAFNDFLHTARGKHLLQRFRSERPDSTVSDMKMLDFVLWQSGGKKKPAKKQRRAC